LAVLVNTQQSERLKPGLKLLSWQFPLKVQKAVLPQRFHGPILPDYQSYPQALPQWEVALLRAFFYTVGLFQSSFLGQNISSENYDETNFSTLRCASKKNSRLSCSNEDPKRPGCNSSPSRQRPKALVGLEPSIPRADESRAF
jgi:hypothetical protein